MAEKIDGSDTRREPGLPRPRLIWLAVFQAVIIALVLFMAQTTRVLSDPPFLEDQLGGLVDPEGWALETDDPGPDGLPTLTYCIRLKKRTPPEAILEGLRERLGPALTQYAAMVSGGNGAASPSDPTRPDGSPPTNGSSPPTA